MTTILNYNTCPPYPMQRRPSLSAAVFALALGTLAPPAPAALYDEIQVYDDSINAPGQFGLEVHVNTTPSGRRLGDFPGEVVPHHSLRMTPELSWGLTPTLEAGLYLPFIRSPQGTDYFAGPKLRMKWLPQQPDPADGGWFWGVNVELSRVGARFEESRFGMELRPILGYRSADWLLVTNPNLEGNLSPGHRHGGPGFSPSVKLARRVGEGISAGFEYYADLGRLSRVAPRSEQAHTLYLTADLDLGPLELNLGAGKGLTGATDRWTVKAILGFSF